MSRKRSAIIKNNEGSEFGGSQTLNRRALTDSPGLSRTRRFFGLISLMTIKGRIATDGIGDLYLYFWFTNRRICSRDIRSYLNLLCCNNYCH